MSLISAVFALSFLIFFHELGHFLAARLFGVKVEVFSIGFGKKIFWLYYKGTQYALSLIPLGGYVKLKGAENADTTCNAANDSLLGKHPLQRIIILFAGPFFNFLFAFFIYYCLLVNGISSYSSKPIIGEVDKTLKAYGILQKNDQILRINNQEITSFQDISFVLNPKTSIQDQYDSNNLESAIVVIKRQNHTVLQDSNNHTGDFAEEFNELELTVPLSIKDNRIILGIAPLLEIQYFTLSQACIKAFDMMKNNILAIYQGIRDMILGIIGLENLSSVIGITEISAKAYDKGFDTFFFIVALISINLGILNLLPLPMLDGGQILFTIYEWIAKKPLHEKIAHFFVVCGLSLIAALMMLGIYNDLTRILLNSN